MLTLASEPRQPGSFVHTCEHDTSTSLLQGSSPTTAMMLAIPSPWNRIHWATWLSDRTNFLQLMSDQPALFKGMQNTLNCAHPILIPIVSVDECGFPKGFQNVTLHQRENIMNGTPNIRIWSAGLTLNKDERERLNTHKQKTKAILSLHKNTLY